MVDWIYQVDFGILNWVQANLRSAVADGIFPLITSLGNNGFVWIVLAVMLIFVKNYRKVGAAMLVALLIGVLVGELFLKELVERARPFTHVPDMQLLVPVPHSFSFPSGHSWSSFAAATVLFLNSKRFGIPALVLAALIAFSRLYVYVHFPSDVLVGSLCGVLTGMLAVFLVKRVMQKRSGCVE